MSDQVDEHVPTEPRYLPQALALGAAGSSLAVAPLGSYTLPLALGVAGLGLLAPDLLGSRSRLKIGGMTFAAVGL